mmetsp:Transcript_23370/g.37293  ORF Transcript_23370/g.37293 Transcript_23370/m.37293 type:complete len:624 (-) Transcript_23370:4333-6204(-)
MKMLKVTGGAMARRLGSTRWMSSGSSFRYTVEGLYDGNLTNVPSLPLPQVEDTLKRYLETVRPLTTDEEFEKSKKLAAEFVDTVGPTLQEKLRDLTAHHGYPYSYIEEFWDEMYQGGRWPAMIHVNPFLSLKDSPDPAKQDQITRAAEFASAATRWWLKVVNGDLEADMERDTQLCMYGYGLVFGATRVPKIGRDVMATNYDRKHIVVICNHQYFKVDIIDDAGQAMAPSELEKILGQIKTTALAQPADLDRDVGILTSWERDAWAKSRQHIKKSDPVNASSIDAIDDCLFALVLEEAAPTTVNNQARLYLHGRDGSNRWFDKHCFVATADGKLSWMFDHTFGDGLTWNRMLAESWSDVTGEKSMYSPLPRPSSSFQGGFEQLQFNLSSQAVHDIHSARAHALKEISNVDLHVLNFEEYGRNRMKEMKMSPDGVTQMAFQLAYMRMHGRPAPTYEACAMKNYNHGRTETIRSCTNESVEMAKAFIQDANDDTKKAALKKAVETHIEVAKGAKAALGPKQGVDRHLYAMKCIAEREGIESPLFDDPVYSRTSTWTLSTSNVSAPHIALFGFGAVTEAGYGLGYMTQPDSVPINITSFNSNKETCSKTFGLMIQESLEDFDRLFK